MTHAIEDRALTDPAEVQEAARQAYRDALDAGEDLSAAELAERFNKTDRWARARRAEVHAEREAERRPERLVGDRNGGRSGGTQDRNDVAEPVVGRNGRRVIDAGPERPVVPPVINLETRRSAPETHETSPATGGEAENVPPLAQNPPSEQSVALAEPQVPETSQGLTQPPPVDRSAERSAGLLTVPAERAAEQASRPVPSTVPQPERGSFRAHDRHDSMTARQHDGGTAERHPERSAVPVGDPDVGVSGQRISWTAFVTGITVSVAANVLHANLPDAPGSPAAAAQAVAEHGQGAMHVAELVGAAFWPIALLLSVEVLTRVKWPRGVWWAFARFGGVGLVGGVAAIVSYRHMAGLLASWGEDWLNAHLGPLAVDGLMLISAAALLAISWQTRTARGAGR
ncbi:MAG TPA: DUF2637 domain-containing protein [Kribbellaceae bacterium]